MITTHGGGTSRKRMHAAKDYSGAEIMRTLRDEVLNRSIEVVDFTSAIELLLTKLELRGAVLQNMETKEILVARAKTVILANRRRGGGFHYQGFDVQPLRRNGRRWSRLSRAREAVISGYAAVPSHGARRSWRQIYGALVTEKVLPGRRDAH